ncbi:MAG TPA: hypothetical protein VJR89_25230 [Polyangiales bacterium]|nr:hypothetical protein [Polyangiales bacterium]
MTRPVQSIAGADAPAQIAAGSESAAGAGSAGVAAVSGAPSVAGAPATGSAGMPGTSLRALGDACSSASQCASSVCEDNHCCERKCGICQACSGAGQCEQVPVGESDPNCASSFACSASGECLIRDGMVCQKDRLACLSGHCETTGAEFEAAVCCSAACPVCSVCSDDGSSCTPLMYGDDPETCADGRSCSAGDCLDADVDRLERQPGHDIGRGQVAYLAQTVTFPKAGELLELRLFTSCTAPVTFHSLAADGTPNRAERARTLGRVVIRPSMTNVAEDALVAFRLSTPLRVRAGEKLAFVMAHDSCFSDGFDIVLGGDELLSSGLPQQDVWSRDGFSLRFAVLLKR